MKVTNKFSNDDSGSFVNESKSYKELGKAVSGFASNVFNAKLIKSVKDFNLVYSDSDSSMISEIKIPLTKISEKEAEKIAKMAKAYKEFKGCISDAKVGDKELVITFDTSVNEAKKGDVSEYIFKEHTDVSATNSKGGYEDDFFKKGEGIIGEFMSETSKNYIVKSKNGLTYVVPKKSVNVSVVESIVNEGRSMISTKTIGKGTPSGSVDVDKLKNKNPFVYRDLKANNITGEVDFLVYEKDLSKVKFATDKYVVVIEQNGKRVGEIGTIPTPIKKGKYSDNYVNESIVNESKGGKFTERFGGEKLTKSQYNSVIKTLNIYDESWYHIFKYSNSDTVIQLVVSDINSKHKEPYVMYQIVIKPDGSKSTKDLETRVSKNELTKYYKPSPKGLRVINESKGDDGDGKVETEAEFRSWGTEVLKDAHGDDYDESKAKKTLDGLVKKYGGDNKWGDAIGALTHGVSESVNESKTISDPYEIKKILNPKKKSKFLDNSDFSVGDKIKINGKPAVVTFIKPQYVEARIDGGRGTSFQVWDGEIVDAKVELVVESVNESKDVWSTKQTKSVDEIDAKFKNLLLKKEIMPYSYEASKLWKSAGFDKKMRDIFGKDESVNEAKRNFGDEFEIGEHVKYKSSYDGNEYRGVVGMNQSNERVNIDGKWVMIGKGSTKGIHVTSDRNNSDIFIVPNWNEVTSFRNESVNEAKSANDVVVDALMSATPYEKRKAMVKFMRMLHKKSGSSEMVIKDINVWNAPKYVNNYLNINLKGSAKGEKLLKPFLDASLGLYDYSMEYINDTNKEFAKSGKVDMKAALSKINNKKVVDMLTKLGDPGSYTVLDIMIWGDEFQELLEMGKDEIESIFGALKPLYRDFEIQFTKRDSLFITGNSKHYDSLIEKLNNKWESKIKKENK